MTSTLFSPVPVDAFFSPLRALSNLATDKAGKLANIQLTALETYVAVGINQCRAAAAAHSPEDLQLLANKQSELVKLLGEKAIMDFQQIMLLGTEFGAETRTALLESSKAVAPSFAVQ